MTENKCPTEEAHSHLCLDEEVTEDCGCTLRRWGDAPCVDFFMCAVHRAAPKMRTALAAVLSAFSLSRAVHAAMPEFVQLANEQAAALDEVRAAIE